MYSVRWVIGTYLISQCVCVCVCVCVWILLNILIFSFLDSRVYFLWTIFIWRMLKGKCDSFSYNNNNNNTFIIHLVQSVSEYHV